MKKTILIILSAVILLCASLAGCGKKEEKVACPMCNGAGEVKYYYGEGDEDYNLGPCTSCDGTGFITVQTDGKTDGVICPSCEKRVDALVTKKDAAGESRSWCADCWAEYDAIMGN